MTMSSSRPYMLRALYEWILENQCTPYILVSAFDDNVEVPLEHVKDGQIILNIAPVAVQNLLIRNDAIDFDGRFAGIQQRVFVPISAVMGIFAKENGQGMVFNAEANPPEPPGPIGIDSSGSSSKSNPQSGRAIRKSPLRLVD